MKKENFKKYLSKKIEQATFDYLKAKAEKHSKSKKIPYDKLKIQEYITDKRFSTEHKILLFKMRSSMDDVKENFKTMNNGDLTCDLCQKDVMQDTSHLLDCQTLLENCPDLYNDTEVEHRQIFQETDKQLIAIKLYTKIFKVKLKLLEKLS